MDVYPKYKNHHEALKHLPREIRSEVLMALDDYAFDGVVPEMSDTALAFFMMVKPSIDKSKTRAEAGQKGGKSKAEDEQNEESDKQDESKSEAKPKQTPSKSEANVKQTSSILNIKYEKQDIKDKNTISRSKPARESDFDELWELYPRKQGRKEAFEAFKRAIRDGDTVEEIRTGIRQYSEHLLRNKTEPRFIKQGSTYFRQRAWKDKYDLPSANFDYDIRTDDMSDVLMQL